MYKYYILLILINNVTIVNDLKSLLNTLDIEYKSVTFKCYSAEHSTEHPSRGSSSRKVQLQKSEDKRTALVRGLSTPVTHFTAESTEKMRIRCLTQGHNIPMPEIELSTSVSRTDILTT